MVTVSVVVKPWAYPSTPCAWVFFCSLVFPPPFFLALTCWQSLISRGLKANEWVNSVSSIMNGKGGGKDAFAQAVGSRVDALNEVVQLAEQFASIKLSSWLPNHDNFIAQDNDVKIANHPRCIHLFAVDSIKIFGNWKTMFYHYMFVGVLIMETRPEILNPSRSRVVYRLSGN